jgi:protein-tyrosine phosphatase
MTGDRHLEWEGCYNARDLGGLSTGDGRMTRWGAVVRSDSPERLSAAGWAALETYGVRTIVDLRNEDEKGTDLVPRPGWITTVHVPLDDIGDEEFWAYWAGGPQFGTPLYDGPFLERKPERCAAALRAVARAEPGGVLVHCGGGRDRTGLVTMLLLVLVGVDPVDIADDYELSYERMRPYYASLGQDDQEPVIKEFFGRQATSARATILALLDSLDVEAYLRSAGLSEADLALVRERLLDPTIT